MSPYKVLLTGATGYIGGSVLVGLLSETDKYAVTALVRKPEDARTLKALGVTPLLGSLDDDEVLTAAAAVSDIVVHTADSADHLRSAQALVRGLQSKGDPEAVYLHTSGTGVLAFSEKIEKPFDDEDSERIHAIPLSAPHREVDAWIEENAHGLKFAILAPSTIHGIGRGPVRRISIQVPNLAVVAIRRGGVGGVGGVGDGATRWNHIHIEDLTDLYLLVLEGLVDGTAPSGPDGGFYFGVSGEHTWGDVYEALGRVLYAKGLVASPAVTQLDAAALRHIGGGVVGFTHESRAVATRGRKLGWKPSRPDLFSTLAEEVDYLVISGQAGEKAIVWK